MATTFPIPTPSEFSTQLEHLVGRGIHTIPAKPVDPCVAEFAVYVNDAGVPVVVCICEVSFAASAGAALSLIPPGVARESMLSLTLSAGLRDNFNEVANILAGLFNGPETPHVRFDTLAARRSRLHPAADALIDNAAGTADYEVSIEGYGSGRISIRGAEV